MFKIKFLFTFMVLAVITGMLFGVAWAQDGSHKTPMPRIYALVFKADWCANCRVLGPKAMKVLPEFVPQGIVPVELDMTNEQTTAKALSAADKLGVRKLVAGNDGTGFIVLADAEKKMKVGKITANMTEDKMKAVFEKALAKTRVRKE